MADMFEKEKETILKSLPDNIKKMFGVMGFRRVDEDSDDEDGEAKPSAAGEEFVPILVLSPYDVPPRPVRDVYWHSLYMTAKKKKKLGELEYLVYQYGADDPDDCYSFTKHEDFVPYDNGIEAGYDKLPAGIQSKIDSGAELTEEERQQVRGLKEMQEDALKAPAERERGNSDFKERHEVAAASSGPPSKKQKKK